MMSLNPARRSVSFVERGSSILFGGVIIAMPNFNTIQNEVF